MEITCATRVAASAVTMLCLEYTLAPGKDYYYPDEDLELLPIRVTIRTTLPATMIAQIRDASATLPDTTFQG